jgi:hypothetical protein
LVDRSYKDNLKKTVILGLTQPGKTIHQIRQERKHGMPSGVAWDGDEEQEKYRDLPVWHYKGEIDDFVIKKLNVPDEVVNERFPSRDDFGQFYMDVVHDITELRNEGSLTDWKHGSGIWRLTHSDLISEWEKKENKRDNERDDGDMPDNPDLPDVTPKKQSWIWSTSQPHWDIVKRKNVWSTWISVEKSAREYILAIT